MNSNREFLPLDITDAVAGRSKLIRKGQAIMQGAVERLEALGLTEDETRRVVENVLAQQRAGKPSGGTK